MIRDEPLYSPHQLRAAAFMSAGAAVRAAGGAEREEELVDVVDDVLDAYWPAAGRQLLEGPHSGGFGEKRRDIGG